MSRYRNFVNFKRKLKKAGYYLITPDPLKSKVFVGVPIDRARIITQTCIYTPQCYANKVAKIMGRIGQELSTKLSGWGALLQDIIKQVIPSAVKGMLPHLGQFDLRIEPKELTDVQTSELSQLQEGSEEEGIQDNELQQVHEHLRSGRPKPEEVASIHRFLLANR